MRTWRCRSCKGTAVWPERECSLCQQSDSLFDAPRPGDYRNTDPRTSRKASAANQVIRQSQKKKILQRMVDGPVTSHDVADVCGGQWGTASKRLGDLRDEGLAVECGTLSPPPGRGGTPRTIYRITEAGERDIAAMSGVAS